MKIAQKIGLTSMATELSSEMITGLGPDTYSSTIVCLYSGDPGIIINTGNFSRRRLRTTCRRRQDFIYAKAMLVAITEEIGIRWGAHERLRGHRN
jgi:hypothetical protein